MAKASHTIEVDGKGFSVRMGWNAVRRIEEVLRESVQVIGMRMVMGEAGVRELGVVFWAGLETARIKDNSRPVPWTMEEVGDLIDDMGADVFFDRVYPQLLIAMTEAFPQVKKAADEKEAQSHARDPQMAVAGGTGTDSLPTPPSTV